MLTSLPGVPVPTLRGDDQLREVGHAVAAFAEVVRDFRAPAGAVWRAPEDWPLHGDTVIHNDIAPWNMLERDQRLCGLVDFDSARPGRAMEDQQRARLLDEVTRVQVSQAARVVAGALGPWTDTARHWNGGRFTVNIARSLLLLDQHRDQLQHTLT